MNALIFITLLFAKIHDCSGISEIFYLNLDYNGEVGCAMDEPSSMMTLNKTSTTPTKLKCVLECLNRYSCVSFNYLKNSSVCQFFDYFPYKILKQPNCTIYDNFREKNMTQEGSNFAKFHPTCQSSTYVINGKKLESWNAVDDFFGVNVDNYECSHTNDPDGDPNWFMVDLKQHVIVDYVRVLARSSTAPASTIRYKNLNVGVTNNSWLVRAPVVNGYPLCGVFGGGSANSIWIRINCTSSTPLARYVIVQQPKINTNNGGYLSLCELQVFGRF